MHFILVKSNAVGSLLCRQESIIYISHPWKKILILGNLEGRWYSGNLDTDPNVFSQPGRGHLLPTPTGDRPHQRFPPDNWRLQCVFRNVQNRLNPSRRGSGTTKDLEIKPIRYCIRSKKNLFIFVTDNSQLLSSYLSWGFILEKSILKANFAREQ